MYSSHIKYPQSVKVPQLFTLLSVPLLGSYVPIETQHVISWPQNKSLHHSRSHFSSMWKLRRLSSSSLNTISHISPSPQTFQLPHTAERGSASGSRFHLPNATGHPLMLPCFPHCIASLLTFSIFSELLEVCDHISHVLESQVFCRVPSPQKVPHKYLIKWTQMGPKDFPFTFQSKIPCLF